MCLSRVSDDGFFFLSLQEGVSELYDDLIRVPTDDSFSSSFTL